MLIRIGFLTSRYDILKVWDRKGDGTLMKFK